MALTLVPVHVLLITCSSMLTRSPRLLRELLMEARKSYKKASEHLINVYVAEGWVTPHMPLLGSHITERQTERIAGNVLQRKRSDLRAPLSLIRE